MEEEEFVLEAAPVQTNGVQVIPATGSPMLRSTLTVSSNNLPAEHQEFLSKENQLLSRLIESKKLPAHIRTVADAFTVGKFGRELGFPIMQAFHYIIPIQGRLTLSAKAIGAILKKNNIKYTTTEDGVYVFRDGTTSQYLRTGSTNPEDKPIDQRTTMVFTRDGETESVNFTWIDATKQGLVEKDNWKRMPKEMLWARCLSKGSNRVAPDFLLGLYSTDEMFDAMGNSSMRVVRDDINGTITAIDAPYVPIESEVRTA